MRKTKSAILEAVHETAMGLHKAGVMDQVTLREFDRLCKAEDQLEALLLEGLSSAESELTPADWSAIRKEALAKVEARKQAR